MNERKYRVAMMFAGDPSTHATVRLEETRLGSIAKNVLDDITSNVAFARSTGVTASVEVSRTATEPGARANTR